MNIKLLGLLCAAVLFAGCAKTVEVKTPVNMKAKNYAEALQSADKSCKIDEDCTSVNKGCCMCAGKEAVNKEAAAALQGFFMKECERAACTLQMCYVDIETSCQNGTCVGTPKPYKNYFVK
ncbi:MAG: hypothetical protein ACI37O_03410 [Candidatus Avelusimicrobium sp.]|uniref:hypothetical protein n=1 Tax=Candidatus Avelusimicrobium sp. TaxID=3048833 RepID=UPI003EFDA724